ATSSAPRKQRRVLVLDRDEIFVGLLVDELFGMQHFPVSSFTTSVPDLPQQFRPFVVGAYTGEQVSMIFNFRALARDQAFLDVAVCSEGGGPAVAGAPHFRTSRSMR